MIEYHLVVGKDIINWHESRFNVSARWTSNPACVLCLTVRRLLYLVHILPGEGWNLMRYWCVFSYQQTKHAFVSSAVYSGKHRPEFLIFWNGSISNDISVHMWFLYIHTYGTFPVYIYNIYIYTYVHFWFLTVSYPILIQSSCFPMPFQAVKHFQSLWYTTFVLTI